MRQKPPRRMITAGKRGCALRPRICQVPVYLMSYFFNKLFCQKKPIVSKRSRQEFLFVYFEPRPHFPFDPTPELPCHNWPADYLHWWTLARPNKKNTHDRKCWKKLVENSWHPFLFYKTTRLPVQWRFLCWNTCSIFVSFPPNCKRISPGQAKVCPPDTQKNHRRYRLIAIDRKKQQKKSFSFPRCRVSLSRECVCLFLFWRRIHPGKIMSLGVDLQTLETVSQNARHQKRYSE